MELKKWEDVNGRAMLGFVLGLAVFLPLVLRSETGFVIFLDHANLLFHEAGHPFVGIFSQRLETYGGTLGQLTFPVVLAVSFWRKGEPISFAASVIWFFENWLNIARYMADARAQELPLLGSGDHDWARIFGRWGLLAHDTQIGWVVKCEGWLGMGLAVAWVGWRYYLNMGVKATPRISDKLA